MNNANKMENVNKSFAQSALDFMDQREEDSRGETGFIEVEMIQKYVLRRSSRVVDNNNKFPFNGNFRNDVKS